MQAIRSERGVGMKGKIDKNGALFIARCGEMKAQFCMHVLRANDMGCTCNDKCPQFGEPTSGKAIGELSKTEISIPIELQICNNRTLYFNEFTDERHLDGN